MRKSPLRGSLLSAILHSIILDVETNSRTNGNGKLSLLSCPCRVFSRIKTLTGGALIYVNDQSGTSDALAAAGSMSAPL